MSLERHRDALLGLRDGTKQTALAWLRQPASATASLIVEYVHENTSFGFVGEIDINALLADLERSRAARLRAWASEN